MRNRIIVSIGLIAYCIGVFAQKKAYPITDTISIEGYYVVQFNKNDIRDKYINEERRKDSIFFQVPIDTEFYPYYFTIKLNNNNVLEEEQIASFVCLQPNYKNTEIYKFLPTRLNSQVDSIFYLYNIKYDIEKVSKYPPKKYFYQLSCKENHLFSIYKVMGKAVRVPVKMDWNIAITNKWDVIPTHINKQIPAFYIYFFYDFELLSVTDNKQLAGFTLWHNE